MADVAEIAMHNPTGSRQCSTSPKKRAAQLANLRPPFTSETARAARAKHVGNGATRRSNKMGLTKPMVSEILSRAGADGVTKGEAIVNKLVELAVNGDRFAMGALLSRYIPEVKQSLNVNIDAKTFQGAMSQARAAIMGEESHSDDSFFESDPVFMDALRGLGISQAVLDKAQAMAKDGVNSIGSGVDEPMIIESQAVEEAPSARPPTPPPEDPNSPPPPNSQIYTPSDIAPSPGAPSLHTPKTCFCCGASIPSSKPYYASPDLFYCSIECNQGRGLLFSAPFSSPPVALEVEDDEPWYPENGKG